MPLTAVVTGASRGIGAAIARELALAGYAVVLGYRERREDAERVVAEITASGGEGCSFRADVSSPSDAKALVDFAAGRYGRLDLLINNAGVSLSGLMTDCTDSEYNLVFDTNMRGVFNMSREAVPHMVRAGGGAIVNISSVWGVCGASCESVYSASKAAVIGFTKALAKELGPSGISVCCVAPGVVDTDMNRRLSEDERRALADEIPLGGFARPEDIAKTVAYLARSPYTSGEVIVQSGGFCI